MIFCFVLFLSLNLKRTRPLRQEVVGNDNDFIMFLVRILRITKRAIIKVQTDILISELSPYFLSVLLGISNWRLSPCQAFRSVNVRISICVTNYELRWVKCNDT